MRISRAALTTVVLTAFVGSGWLITTRSAASQQEKKKAARSEAGPPRGVLVRLPEAGEEAHEEQVVYSVPIEGVIEIEVAYNIPEEETVKAKVNPEGILDISHFRKVRSQVIVDGKVVEPKTGKGHAVLILEPHNKGEAKIQIRAGRRSYLYNIKVE